MANIRPSLIGGLLPRLGQQPAMGEGFLDWIISGHYSFRAVSGTSVIYLDVTNLDQFVQYLSFDFERFSFACRESFLVTKIEQQSYSLVAWPLLKLYYSSFFAAHAIMRSQGSGVTLLTSKCANYLNSIINSVSPGSLNVSSGTYIYKTMPSATQSGVVSVQLQEVRDSGGVHEIFWKTFCKYMSDLSANAVTTKSANATEFVAGVDSLSSALLNGGNGSGAWISAMRNEINYQHKHEVWYPLRKNGSPIKAITNISNKKSDSIRLDISKKNHSIVAFANVCQFLSCLDIEISEYVAARSSAGRSFGQKWRRFSEKKNN